MSHICGGGAKANVKEYSYLLRQYYRTQNLIKVTNMQESINKLITEIFSRPTLTTRHAHGYAHGHANGHARAQGDSAGGDALKGTGQEQHAYEEEGDAHLLESADLLYAYIEAELSELNVGLMFPDVHRQLAGSVVLQNAYSELRQLLVMERENRLEEPPLTPSFDFSYLKEQETPDVLLAQSWSLDRMGRLVIDFTSALLQSIRPLDLQPALLKTGEPTHADKMYFYELKNQVEDLNVEIGVKLDSTNPSHCYVAAWIAVPSRGGWPNWKNSRVIMKMGEEVLQSHTTDAFGRILFDPIDLETLPNLAFEVTPVTLLH